MSPLIKLISITSTTSSLFSVICDPVLVCLYPSEQDDWVYHGIQSKTQDIGRVPGVVEHGSAGVKGTRPGVLVSCDRPQNEVS